jgi:site-specific DNA-cytosine methylase
MNVLSLFDGISCAYEGLKRAGIDVKQYYACEIDKYAIKVSQSRHPDIVRPTNDVRELIGTMVPEIDLLIGGSPCQDLSIAKKDRKGLSGDRSGLFWEYVRILKEVKPKYFVLENVASMAKADKDLITETMGVEPVMFNASLVSAQMRKRLFWTNIKFELPEDRGILLKDILQPDAEVDERMVTKDGKGFCLDASYYKGSSAEHTIQRKSRTMVMCEKKIRKLTPIECERLQGLPDDYTAGVSNTQRYKCLGNAFNVEVVATIIKNIVL